MLITGQVGVDNVAQRVIQPFLKSGESLLWAEKPQGWRVAWPESFRLIFFIIWNALVWSIATGFVPWKAMSSMISQGELRFELISSQDLPFLLVPLVMIIFGFVALTVSARSYLGGWFTYYGLTNDRVVILRKVLPASITTFGSHTLATMSRTGESGRGTISFGDAEAGYSAMWASAPKKLIGIRNPARVEELIVSTLMPKKTEGRYS